jgi:hypothetical protein
MLAQGLLLFLTKWQTGVERNLILPDNPDRILKLTTPQSQILNGGLIMKAGMGKSDAEKRIEGIQSICLSEKKTECVCPKCGARHRVKLLWTGRGMPRKFCPICKHYSISIDDTDPFSVSKVAGGLSSSSI